MSSNTQPPSQSLEQGQVKPEIKQEGDDLHLIPPAQRQVNYSDNHSHTHLYRFSSLGLSLTDTLDDLINEQRIEPQLAMKVLANFDRVVTEVLAEKVKARLTFKVYLTYTFQ
jgi:hypothetical protein